MLDNVLSLTFDGRAGVLYLVYLLAAALPSMAVGARRLHDTGRSGFWQLISVIPIVGPIILIVFWATDGHRGPNEYGMNPKEVAAPGGQTRVS